MSNENEQARHHRGGHPKLTLYRILVIALTAGFGLWKAALSYRGESTAPTTLDWVYGVVVFLLLYWLGIYEKYALHNMPWLFEQDYLAPFKKLFSQPRRNPTRSSSIRLD
ncbi:hypothetical protein K443DRAFT_672030 [Laccaria amethystina LaAM-08-1]|uniref:Uncharacterized protein n=1 Tax=Laccaria amethystina LaAM-08-1 TaxID=1095629 RepID=A0A0C9XVE0_9AGAR|nr:hypothetical protein K443DRAFT_672030 [Laccaria amethystina LaAM-08-1]